MPFVELSVEGRLLLFFTITTLLVRTAVLSKPSNLELNIIYIYYFLENMMCPFKIWASLRLIFLPTQVGVPAEVAVVIALASFIVGAGLTGLLCCIHHRKATPKTVSKFHPSLISVI